MAYHIQTECDFIKTMVICGSPRKNGDSMVLVSEMRKYLKGEVKEFYAYYDRISPCIDCRYCWENPGCSIKDRMQEIYAALNEVDNLIIASPVHFSELSGRLLSLFSRFQTLYAAKYKRKSPVTLKKKNGVLLLSRGGDGAYENAVETAKSMFRHTNTNYVGSALSLKTNEIPASDDLAALQSAQDLALMLNSLYDLATA